jgi:hypothetical protein
MPSYARSDFAWKYSCHQSNFAWKYSCHHSNFAWKYSCHHEMHFISKQKYYFLLSKFVKSTATRITKKPSAKRDDLLMACWVPMTFEVFLAQITEFDSFEAAKLSTKFSDK